MKTTKEQRRELRAILGEHREIGVAWVPTDGGLLRELLDDVDETEAEIERLEAGWMEFESIEPETGNLRPSHAALLRALEDARDALSDAGDEQLEAKIRERRENCTCPICGDSEFHADGCEIGELEATLAEAREKLCSAREQVWQLEKDVAKLLKRDAKTQQLLLEADCREMKARRDWASPMEVAGWRAALDNARVERTRLQLEIGRLHDLLADARPRNQEAIAAVAEEREAIVKICRQRALGWAARINDGEPLLTHCFKAIKAEDEIIELNIRARGDK